MSAALGASQFRRLDRFLADRGRVADLYNGRLAGFSWLRTPVVRPEVRMSWFVYVVTLAEGLERDPVMSAMEARGVPVRGYFPPVHLQPYIRSHLGTGEGELPVTESVARRTVALPFHNRMEPEDVEHVARTLSEVVEESHAGR
jgi:perosamine synthetase